MNLIKIASIFSLIGSTIWLLVEIYWIGIGLSEGWLNMDNIVRLLIRVLMLVPPTSFIFLSLAFLINKK